MAVQEATAPPGGDPTTPCPKCGNALAPNQLFCLSCGARVGLSHRKPPSWKLPVAVVAFVLLVAGAGVAIALNEISEDSERAASAPSPIETLETERPPAAGPAETAQGERTQPDETEEPPAPAPTGGGGIAEWPKDTSAYTVVLLSAGDRAAAEARARDAIRRGIPAGVLHSDDYPTLNRGYWVVFAGEFDSEEEARGRAAKYAAQGFAGGYARFVSAED